MDRSFSWSEGQRPPTDPESAPLPLPVIDVCDFCQLSSESNTHGQPEKLLKCKDCNAKGKREQAKTVVVIHGIQSMF